MKLFSRLTPLHIVFTIVLAGIVYLLKQSDFEEYIHTAIWGTLIFYFVQGLVINLSIDWAKKK